MRGLPEDWLAEQGLLGPKRVQVPSVTDWPDMMVPETTHESYSLLITDDDVAFRESLRGIFEPEGFRTVLAGSGEEAIDIIRHQQVHLALLDQHLPRLTGLDTLRILRHMNALLPVILLTGEDTQQLLRDALSANAFCVISKPVDRHVVVYTVQLALAQHYPAARGSDADRPHSSGPFQS